MLFIKNKKIKYIYYRTSFYNSFLLYTLIKQHARAKSILFSTYERPHEDDSLFSAKIPSEVTRKQGPASTQFLVPVLAMPLVMMT